MRKISKAPSPIKEPQESNDCCGWDNVLYLGMSPLINYVISNSQTWNYIQTNHTNWTQGAVLMCVWVFITITNKEKNTHEFENKKRRDGRNWKGKWCAYILIVNVLANFNIINFNHATSREKCLWKKSSFSFFNSANRNNGNKKNISVCTINAFTTPRKMLA